MLYEEKFRKVHKLLKEYGCKQTFSFHKEYESPTVLGGRYFYRPVDKMHIDHPPKEWEEKVDAKLDVCVPTNMPQAEKREIRFDIDWSNGA